MKNILERYEKLSGQAINFTKSTMVFSPKTRATCRQQINNTLQIQESSLPGNYLGLPLYIGRQKNSAFKLLTERVSQKLQVWRNKSMSKEGKMVLLKMAAQSILNFWMNFFLIPSEVCNGIQRRMNEFWCKNGERGKWICWLAWERLCEGKQNEGWGLEI